MPATSPSNAYKPIGAMEQLFYSRAPVVLVEGPAHTGKSFGILWYMLATAVRFAGSRQWIGAETRSQISDSVLATFENKILPLSTAGRAALRGAARSNRHSYKFPNGSEIVTGGLNEPARLYGTEWDKVYISEIAPNVTYDQYQQFHRAMRNKRVPMPGRPGEFLHQIIMDCNPDVPTFWANVNANEGKIERIITRHSDNPSFTAADQERLDLLTGVRRRRLRDGEWCAAEGQVWEEFDRAVHVIPNAKVKDIPRLSNGEPAFRHYVMGQDWGHRAPGVLQLWGLTGDGTLYLLREHYRAGKTIDWWIGAALEYNRAWKPITCVCDPEDSGSIELYQRAGIPAVAADKRNKLSSLDQVRDRLKRDRQGRAGMYFMADALEERDAALKAAYQPCSTVEEIPGYVLREIKEGRGVDDETDPACPDHGCDATRYVVRFADALFPSRSIVRSDQLDTIATRWSDEMPEELAILERGSARDAGAAPIRWPWSGT
jgi:hypothetical protein